MDIKAALNTILPRVTSLKEPVDKSIKMGGATDRDANGQTGYGDQQEKRPPMSQEQFEKALEHLKEIPAIKEHNLVIEAIEVSGKRFVILKEVDGKVIRRIPEIELWSLPVFKKTEPHGKGQLISKSA